MDPISVVIFGNTNNYPLLLAQGLQALGNRVRIILNRKEILHRPEARYPDWKGAYPDWVIDCSDMTDEDVAYRTPAIDQAIYHMTNDVDLVILNDSGPALADNINTPYVVFLTGSDLLYYANFESIPARTRVWDPEFKRSFQGRRYINRFSDFVMRQRDGILGAKLVCYAQRGLVPSGDCLLDEIGVTDQRRLMMYLSNTIDLQTRAPAGNRRLRVLCGSRILYRPERNPALTAMDFKRTDILLMGVSLFVRNGGQAELILPRKGQDVDAAVELVAELGLMENVRWIDEMPLSVFYEEMVAADLICDQFGSTFPSMVTLDSYALGRPVIANLRNDVFSQYFNEPLPGFDANSPEQIAAHLTVLERDRKALHEMGFKGRAYAEKFLSPVSMARQLLNKYASCAE